MYVPEIDAEHQQMFRAAAQLRQAVLAGEKPKQLESLVRRLAGEIAGHFLHEEHLMRGSRYPAFEWHRRQHVTARRRIASVRLRIRRGDRQQLFEALESLAGWLRDHTSVADRIAGAYLRNYQRQRYPR